MVSGLRHGFLVGPWLEEARPLPAARRRWTVSPCWTPWGATWPSASGGFPVSTADRGASPPRLFEMAAFNAKRALGPYFSAPIEEWRERVAEVARLERPVLTDNRMHAWEWLVPPGGRILKADAVDHHRSNDLVGPQDPAWDLAAAAVELDLGESGLDLLADALARRSGAPRAAPVQLGFYTVAYLAFQAGRCTLAAEAVEPSPRRRRRGCGPRWSGTRSGCGGRW